MQLLTSIGRNDDAPQGDDAESYICECGEPATRSVDPNRDEPVCDKDIARMMAQGRAERRDINELPDRGAHAMSLMEIEALADELSAKWGEEADADRFTAYHEGYRRPSHEALYRAKYGPNGTHA